METRFRTSFVPKKALAVKTEVARGGTIHLFFALGVIVFLTALLGAGGVYLYKTILQSSIADKSIQLEKAKKAFEPVFIRDAKRLDARIRASRELTEKHIVASPVLALLSESTLQTIRYTDFSYAYNKGQPSLTLTGESKGSDTASGYASVALQSDAYGEDERIREPIFSGLRLTQNGTVQFAVEARLDPALLPYSKTLAAAEAVAEDFGGERALPSEDAMNKETSGFFPEE